jgi:SagB-type dehydrogenase family enzyme
VIVRRGSARRFTHDPISFEHLSTILDIATRGTPADVAAGAGDAGAAQEQPQEHSPVERLPDGRSLVEAYLIVNAVEGLPAGTYAFDREHRGLTPLKQGDFRAVAGYLDLGQDLAADAAVNIYHLADLQAILPRLGNRGYRAAQLEAAIEGGKLYLAAYALGLGATGLTFFDDDVTGFFSPPAAGKSVMFLTAIGHPARRA